jgi:hypothetical protein
MNPDNRTRWIAWLGVPMLLALALIVAAPATQAGGRGQEKVTICHIPPGNPDNAHEITVGAPAVPAHLAHGDTLGECDVEVPPDDAA